MKKIKPIFTEKSSISAKNGEYSFWVDKALNKYQIKELVESAFGVHVKTVRVANEKKLVRRTMRGQILTKMPRKKAIVSLLAKEKIDIFEETK